jgi:tetratricopeptide (TPR) repeat protein
MTHRTHWLQISLVIGLALAACKDEPPKEAAHVKLGDLLLAQGKYAAAVVEYQKMLGTPSDAVAQARLASVYETQGDFVSAERALAALHAKSQADTALALSLARVRALAGKPRTAFDAARAIVEKSPGDVRALALLSTFVSTPDQAKIAIDLMNQWITVHSKAASSKHSPAAETLLPLAALYDLRKDAENAAQARTEAERIGAKDLDLALEIANTSFGLQHLTPAAEVFLAAGKLAPTRSATWLRLAAVELGRRRYVQAQSALDHLKGDAATQPETTLLRARALLGQGKLDEAKRQLQPLLGTPELAAQAHFWLGNLETARGDTKAAEAALLTALEKAPGLVIAELALADLYLSTKATERALARLTEVAKRESANAAVLRALGHAHMQVGDAAAAQRVYQRLAEVTPEDPEALLLEARALIAQQKLEDAERKLEASIALSPGAAPALRELITTLVQRGELAKAEARVQAELERTGRSARLLTLLGDVLAQQRTKDPSKFEAAEKAYREATTEAPDDATTWVALGNLYADSDRADRAALMYAEAQKRSPDQPDAFLRTAQLAIRQGQHAQAEQAYLEVLKHHPTLVPALNNLAYLYLDALRAPDKAVELASRAHQAAPDAPNVTDTYGWALLGAGKPAEALPLLEQAVAALPESAEVQFHVGMARVAAGKRAEGQEALRRALELSQTFRGHEQARAALRK